MNFKIYLIGLFWGLIIPIQAQFPSPLLSPNEMNTPYTWGILRFKAFPTLAQLEADKKVLFKDCEALMNLANLNSGIYDIEVSYIPHLDTATVRRHRIKQMRIRPSCASGNKPYRLIPKYNSGEISAEVLETLTLPENEGLLATCDYNSSGQLERFSSNFLDNHKFIKIPPREVGIEYKEDEKSDLIIMKYYTKLSMEYDIIKFGTEGVWPYEFDSLLQEHYKSCFYLGLNRFRRRPKTDVDSLSNPWRDKKMSKLFPQYPEIHLFYLRCRNKSRNEYLSLSLVPSLHDMLSEAAYDRVHYANKNKHIQISLILTEDDSWGVQVSHDKREGYYVSNNTVISEKQKPIIVADYHDDLVSYRKGVSVWHFKYDKKNVERSFYRLDYDEYSEDKKNRSYWFFIPKKSSLYEPSWLLSRLNHVKFIESGESKMGVSYCENSSTPEFFTEYLETSRSEPEKMVKAIKRIDYPCCKTVSGQHVLDDGGIFDLIFTSPYKRSGGSVRVFFDEKGLPILISSAQDVAPFYYKIEYDYW